MNGTPIGDSHLETVTGYSFRHDDLRVAERLPGVSAFMRIRNGEDFLEASIRTHIDAFDEIVAVYNQCTDSTPDILARLAQEYGPKLRLFHYADRVYPAGTKEHAAEPADSPNSLVNYYNFALSRTRYAIATKLDDDHLAIPDALRRVCDGLRAGLPGADTLFHCFSGLNLARDAKGRFAVPASATISGGGDIGFFRVSPETYFYHDRRWERMRRGGLTRNFTGFLYWHLKFLKRGEGFANYELESNPDGRYDKMRQRLHASSLLDLPQVREHTKPVLKDRLLSGLSEKRQLTLNRSRAVPQTFPQATFEEALDATSPGWRKWIGDAR